VRGSAVPPFVALAASLSATDFLPVAGIALVLGVDRFMSEARALTNVIGCAVATIVVAKLEGEFDVVRAREILAYPKDAAALRPRQEQEAECDAAALRS
jgi:aerobic C4-dicarboxylate transport protein